MVEETNLEDAEEAGEKEDVLKVEFNLPLPDFLPIKFIDTRPSFEEGRNFPFVSKLPQYQLTGRKGGEPLGFADAYGCFWILNLIRRVEIMLAHLINEFPDSERKQEALTMLNGIMLLEDYFFDSTIIDSAFSSQLHNELINETIQLMLKTMREAQTSTSKK